LLDGELRLTELFPYDDDGKGDENGVDHTDRCEFEAGNLVIAGQPFESEGEVLNLLENRGGKFSTGEDVYEASEPQPRGELAHEESKWQRSDAQADS